MAGTAHLVQTCSRRLAEFLREVDETDLVWLAEIRDEAARMFGSDCNDEPELMPKTPSQKNRRRKKRISLVQDENEDPTRKRLSRRRNSSIKPRSSKRYSQRLQNKDDLGKICAAVEEASLHEQVTRSEATAPAKCSEAFPEKSAVKAIEERIPFVEISVNDRSSAELHLQGNVPETADEVSRIICLSSNDESPPKNGMVENQSVLEASVLVVSQTPEANGARGSRGASKLKIANILTTKATINEEPKEVDGCALGPQDKQTPGKELSQDLKDNAGTPTGSRSSRCSVRRSLMGKTSFTRRTSLAEKYSLASKRESMIRKSVRNSSNKKIRKSSQVSNNVNCYSSIVTLVDEEKKIKNGSVQESSTSKQDPQGPRMSLRTRNAKKIAISNLASQQQQQEESSKERNSNESGETLEPPQSVRRKPSYKKAVDQLYDGQQAEEGGLSPPRKKTPSPPCPASKVVRPFKTFLHTVQKNQLLMTPSSVGRNNVVKSFIKHNTPLRTDPKEKERQRLESLRKKQDAEQQRKQKLEEEKRRRLEEMKLKREERLRKVLQARERVEQIEEEKKRRIEQKLAQVDEKTEKVREERLAEEKIKKRVAAKKMEEAEARRKQDEDARKLKALQLEEEERRHKELMQKRKEEEQERVRKIAEQRQAEQERERQLAAERELEKKKEQERIQAERERERQEKEKILRQQKELMAAREKERLRQEMEEKKKRQEEQRLAELEQQEQEKRKLQEEQEKKAKLVESTAGSKQLNVTVDVENSSLCNSYQMTPQGLKGPKPPKINPSNNYGMDLNSDDSTDDESQPRKPIPAWANGSQLSQAVIHQYYNPLNTDMLFGTIISPKLEDIFYKSKPRYFKRTSSAVWNSPPFGGAKNVLGLPYSLKKY
ncbi:inner centromere protein isoform X2 [Alligator mississippiensis]|uniref:Inner centromere protein isoform B n=1 Tax=Alligator mississippiensis TaxID=8496 RepID=A0A151NXM3_ALLMI|nr:inner centromere protein isoform X2 [Alligator mississippiensis]KYO41631.1 inner centromere protein isoform B [Alligator mississippiensis]